MNRAVEWFVDNPVAANLLMLLIVVGGLVTIPTMDKQFFPETELNEIHVTVVYPGAGPAEVEEQIVKRIEDAVHDLDGIDKLRSTAREGQGEVVVEAETGYDTMRLLNDVKSRVDAINTFPVDAERPQVTEQLWRSRMISVELAGDIGEASLKELGERIRDQMADLPSVSQVELHQPRDYQLDIEVSELALRRYGLRFDDVVQAVRGASINLPAGRLRTADGDIQIRTRGQRYHADEFEGIVLLRRSDGTRVLLGDVAEVIDGFADQDVITRFNDRPALSLEVYVTSHPDVLATSKEVRDFVERMRPRLPPGVELTVWRDMSIPFKGRVNTLVTNGIGGLALVFVVLLLFLRPRLAFWVSVGIAVAFLGAFWLLPLTGSGLNMVTLFALILILGIIVDDAIIVGESVHTSQQSGLPGPRAALLGTQAVLKPVFYAVVTTMMVFVTFFFLPGDQPGTEEIPKVVLLALGFSLIESIFILPSHLAHMPPERPARSGWLAQVERMRTYFSSRLARFACVTYRPFLERCLRWRGLTLVSFIVVLLIVLAIYIGGWIRSSFFPRVPMDYLVATVEMPRGTAFSQTERVLARLEGAALALKREHNRDGASVIGNIESTAYADQVQVTVELDDANDRNIAGATLAQQWRDKIGPLAQVRDFDIRSTIVATGKAIELELAAADLATLQSASASLKRALSQFAGVRNVRDSLEHPRPEIELKLKPRAQTLNVALADLARQVRRGFYGEEVQRIPRDREDIKVLVRYPESARRSIDALRDMRIRTPAGDQVPFETVADLRFVDGYSQIDRVDRKRVARVSAELEPGAAGAAQIVAAVKRDWYPQWKARHPGLSMSLEGEEQERTEFLSAMWRLMGITTLAIYGLMAVVFRSYWQPVLIVSAIPYGLMGAIVGHLLMGREISMFSLLGIIASAGVVVNDNLVLIDRINRLREAGESLSVAVVQGSVDRFRAIVLTSVTTFIGLVPIMTERSVQAQFLIPMVISLAFGVLLATFGTLLFTPCLYLLLQGVRDRLKASLDRLRPQHE